MAVQTPWLLAQSLHKSPQRLRPAPDRAPDKDQIDAPGLSGALGSRSVSCLWSVRTH